jgi:biopolymer transport protein TolQ
MGLFDILKYAYVQSDSVGKGIVILLFLTSLYAWGLMLDKGFGVMAVRKSCKVFLRLYERVKSPVGMGQHLDDIHGPLKEIAAAGIRELFAVCAIHPDRQNAFFRHCHLPRELSSAEMDKIRSTMNRALNVQVLVLEERLVFLSTIVSLAPFLGLFGTVWGVMATFVAIAQSGMVELSAIAPGISGALLTTVAGLVVAIPSLIGNNAIVSSVQATIAEMETFVEDFLASIRLEDADKPSARVTAQLASSDATAANNQDARL